ncbi:MAG: hypothetical protein P8Z79_17645 [Sedimentisphaerales bacterium]|jgi:hypothetical protein
MQIGKGRAKAWIVAGTSVGRLGAGDVPMNERNDNNPRTEELNEGKDLNDDFVPDDALPLCPRCLNPCRPLQYYCPYCNSNDAINPLTPYIAFLNIRFNYDIFITMWRKIWYDRDTSMIRRLFYLWMVTAFVPVIVIFGLPLLFVGKIPQPRLRSATMILLCIVAMALFVLFVFVGFAAGPFLQ